MKIQIILSFYFLLLISNLHSQLDSILNFQLKIPSENEIQSKFNIWGTYYYIHTFESSGTIPLLLKEGVESGLYADTCDFCIASLEGTVMIRDKKSKTYVLNYSSTSSKNQIDCNKCNKLKNSSLDTKRLGSVVWEFTEGFGQGIENFNLVPFRTIAVDNQFIPYGSIVFIPKIKGLIFTDDSNQKYTHDGYFFAGDTGSAIKENHFDFFIGLKKENPFSTIITSNKNDLMEIYIINNRRIREDFLKMVN